MNFVKLAVGIILSSIISINANAGELIQNGNFSAGLSGWTSYLTTNGTISPTTPNQGGVSPTNSPALIASFNVNGAGASDAAWLNAGQYLPPYGTANPAGGGISQIFFSGVGIGSFTADIAATTRFAGDAGGIFSVLLDGVALDSVDFGAINGTTRSSLGFTTNLTAGQHILSLQVVRPFAPGVGLRSQYFDNASLNFTAAVPEPATWAMLVTGFGVVGFGMRRRRKTSTGVAFAG